MHDVVLLSGTIGVKWTLSGELVTVIGRQHWPVSGDAIKPRTGLAAMATHHRIFMGTCLVSLNEKRRPAVTVV